jgi:hypothetical protein
LPADEHNATDGRDQAGPADRSASTAAAQKSLVMAMLQMGLAVDDIAEELARKFGERPRRAYRIARELTSHEAVERFNDRVRGTDAQPDAMLTLEELQDYESDSGGGPVPSLSTLTLLAQVYDTDVRNLVDFDDRMRLGLRDRALLDREAQPASQSGQSVSALLIGQATALLALVAAVIYAAGDLYLGFKLWFLRDTWAPVLSGLPRDLVLVSAIGDTILALIAALPTYYCYRQFRAFIAKREARHSSRRPRWPLLFLRILGILLSAVILSVVPVLFIVIYTHRLFAPDVLQPLHRIFWVCLVINLVVVGLGSLALWLVDTDDRSPVLRHSLSVGAMAIAFIPCAASVYATYPLPRVVLCGPAFYYMDSAGRHYMVGNLIGDTGQWAYVAETRKTINGIAAGAYISEVPLSAVRLETIGPSAECDNLVPMPASPQPTTSATATPSP